MNEASAEYISMRRKKDPTFRVLINTRKRIWDALKGRTKSDATAQLMGGVEAYRKHIESLLPPEWTWENYGSVWEIDHKKSLSTFDLSDPEQQKIAFHFSNTQPLLISHNRSKGAR